MTNLPLEIWKSIENPQTKAIALVKTMLTEEVQLGEIVDVWADLLEADGVAEDLTLALTQVYPLMREHEGISKLRLLAIPELLSPREAVLNAQQEYRLSLEKTVELAQLLADTDRVDAKWEQAVLRTVPS